MRQSMPSLKALGKNLTSKTLWVDAAGVIVGFKVSTLANAYIGPKLGFLPGAVQPFVGPVIVVAAAHLIPDASGFKHSVMVGGIAHAGSTLLGMTGIAGLQG